MQKHTLYVCPRTPVKRFADHTRSLMMPAVMAFLTAATMGLAQTATPTQIQIGSTVVRPAVRAFGMNVTEQNFWDAGQIHKNLVFRNPGFEPLLYQSVMRCVSGSATSCTDDTGWGAWPSGFWTGGRYELVSNGQTIRSGTIANYTAPSGGGSVYTFAESGTAPASGDVILRKQFNGNADNAATGWWTSASGGATITSETSDLPPGTAGMQAVRLNAMAAGSTLSLISYFDSSAGRTYVQLNGSYRIQFKAKGAGGANQLRVSAGRGGTSFASRTITLTTGWQDYTVDFTASETGSSIGTANLTFAVSAGSAALLDEVNFHKTSEDPANTTAFREPVVRALQQLKPGMLRYWAEHLGESLDNQIAPVWARKRAGYRISYNTREDVNYGLHEFLELCQYLGADPWIVVPLVYSPQEAANLIEYLAGPSTSPYGARRAARGRSAPWTDQFTKIHLEFGNEAWNGVFRGGTIEYPNAYGPRAQTIFGSMRSSSYYQASKFDLVLGGQAVWIGRNRDIQNFCNNNDSMSIAPYMMYDVNNYANNEELFGPLFAEAEMNSRNGVSQQNRVMLNAFGRPIGLAAYEMNLHTTGGTISQAALDLMIPSTGSGLAVTASMLQMLRDLDMRSQNFYSLQQSFYGRPDGRRVRLWGAVVDMGVTDRRRPQFLALQLVNNAMAGSDLMATTHSGPNPTWEQASMNGVQLSGARYLQSFAFRQGNRYKLVLYNLHRTSALPVNFGGSAMPSGTVTMERFGSAQITDNNETSEMVRNTTQTLTSFNPSASFSLPAFSMTVLTWDQSGGGTVTPPPVQPLAVTGVTTSGITQNSATIVWTTNLASNSQVAYGTTSALGQNTPLDAAQVTTHTVTISGLAAGTTYSYQARSATASETATSTVLQFATTTAPPAALTISGGSVSGITSSGFTMSWTTNVSATSQVECSSSAAPTVTTAYTTTAATTHSISVTGLNASTTYTCLARSRVGTGTPVNSAPVVVVTSVASSTPTLTISAVTSTGLSATGVTLSWSTNSAATSQAECTNTASGVAVTTGYTSAAATSHAIPVSGLAASTSYSCRGRSRTSSGQSAQSAAIAVTTPAAPSSGGGGSTGTGANITWLGQWGQTNTAITISWSTNVNTTGYVEYGTVSGSYPLRIAASTSLAMGRTVNLTGLSNGTQYYYRVRVKTASGAETISAVQTFQTLDRLAPVISNIQVTKLSANSVRVTWTTNEPCLGAVQYGSTTSYTGWAGSTSGTATSHTATMNNLPAGVTNYRVWTKDAADNVGTSANLTITMP
jgi:hypothetical protein